MIFAVEYSVPTRSKPSVMKVINLLFIILILLPVSVSAQNIPDNPRFNNPEKNRKCPVEIMKDFRIDPEIMIDPGFFSDPSLKKESGKSYDELIERLPERKLLPDFRIAEEPEIYPGAPKFYSKHRMIPSPFEKSFIIKHRPDPFAKYYLIIKDPITHRIIN